MQVRATVEGKRSSPDAKLFIGSGKADELKVMLESSETSLVAFNHDLSPSQQRNLERFLQAKVLDRTGLILDIFAQRAQTHEGKLQVELAQLEHLSTRLVRGWTHLERQKGGIGVRGGPGETQLELDRRMLRVRVKQLPAGRSCWSCSTCSSAKNRPYSSCCAELHWIDASTQNPAILIHD